LSRRIARAEIKRQQKQDAKIAKNVEKIRAQEAEKIAKATERKGK
jgi:hypothetical protein